jgi:hypothetical protein
MLVTPMCMAPALYYFLPRADAPTKRLYINQTMLFLVGAGLVSAWILSTANPFLPGKIDGLLESTGAVVPAFVFTWVFASMLDVLPTAEERVGWQAKVVVSLAAVRADRAFPDRRSSPASWSRCCGCCSPSRPSRPGWCSSTSRATTASRAGGAPRHLRRAGEAGGAVRAFRDAARHPQPGRPVDRGGALHRRRSSPSFSVATVLAPIVQIFRQSVNHVFLPSMSRLQSEGDFKAMLALNSRANDMVALLVYPLLAFAFVFAEEIITLIYTRTYLEGAPVLRLYVVALVAFVVELVSVLFVLKQGAFAARVNGWCWRSRFRSAGTAPPIGVSWARPPAASPRSTPSASSRSGGSRASPARRWRSSRTGTGSPACWARPCSRRGSPGLALHWAPWSTFARLVAAGALVAITYPLALRLFGQFHQLTQFIASLRNKAPA